MTWQECTVCDGTGLLETGEICYACDGTTVVDEPDYEENSL